MISSCSLILLAAGRSSRMGYPKGLLSVGDTTLIEFQIKRFLKMGGVEIIVVVGKEHTLYKKCLESYKVILVENLNIDAGPFYSVTLGVKAASNNSVLILPVDVPLATKDEMEQIFQCRGDGVIAQHFETKKGGHPLLIRESVLKKLRGINHFSDQRLDYFLKDEKFKIERVDCCHPYMFLNLNNESDYLNFLELERAD